MSKMAVCSDAMLFSGIDVSAATLAVAVQREHREGLEQRQFANSAAGHKQLIGWLLKRGRRVRVSLEATGIYSLDVALALDAAEGIEVAVLNPKRVNQFAQTLRRSKTDAADAVGWPSTAAGCRSWSGGGLGGACSNCARSAGTSPR